MSSRTVDVVALGPAPLDPYDPAASAWALAAAFAAGGDDVRVLRPEGPAAAPLPPGVATVEVPLPLRRPGAAVDQAGFAAAAGQRIRRTVDLVVRDPSGLGALGAPGRTPGHPPLVAFVRSVELQAFDREHRALSRRGWSDRLDAWRDRRSVRRLEQAALAEADVLFADDDALAPALAREYGVAGDRVRSAVPPVADLARPASRVAARAALEIPPDVPVVVAPTPDSRAASPVVDRARETFRRIRPLFPGARLVVAGAIAPADPGVISVPGREGPTFGAALTAADVALFAGGQPAFDPLVIGAMRSGCAVAAVPSVRLPSPPEGALQYSATDDLGDLASALAELFADPALVREVVRQAALYAARYDPERIARAVNDGVSGRRA